LLDGCFGLGSEGSGSVTGGGAWPIILIRSFMDVLRKRFLRLLKMEIGKGFFGDSGMMEALGVVESNVISDSVGFGLKTNA